MTTLERLYECIDLYHHYDLLNEDIDTFEKFVKIHNEFPEQTIDLLLDIIEDYEPF